MAQYGSLNVDTKFSSAIEPNLYSDTVLMKGITFTDKYTTGPAGEIKVHKLGKGNGVTVGTPGRDFTDEAISDNLITISFNNNFQKSNKIYGVQAAAVDFAVAEESLADALKQTKEAREYAGIACLVKEGTASTRTGAITDVVEELTALRKEIKDNKGKANFALVSTEIYAELLKVVGIQSYADEAVRSGELIKRFGLNIIECNLFDEDEAKYYDNGGTLRTVDVSGVAMIVGSGEAFSLLDNVSMYRLIDSENFNGSKAQVEYNTAMTVNSPAQIIVRKNAASSL